MPTIKANYSPSINIVRDNDVDFNYIVTPNTSAIFGQLFNDVLTGIKAHTIIGAYGIGKSSFLLATEQTLSKKKIHFKGYEKVIKQLPSYEFVNIIGDYSSIIETIGKEFGISGKKVTAKDVINSIINKAEVLKKKKLGLAIIIDEFGKFLEYASVHNPESELYFIQQIAELVNSNTTDMLFITTLHQNFNAYSAGLNRSQQNEWDKVNGRLKSIVFNEPVEQLLFIAAERLYQKNKGIKADATFEKLFKCIQQSKAFPLREHLELEFAKKLLPFDILSAAVLTSALQKYGQNERSLFSFIESNDYSGLNDSRKEGYYSLPQVYDYLMNNFYSVLTTAKNNSNYAQWSAIRSGIEKTEGVLQEDLFEDAWALLKAIGLLNIFGSSAGRLDIGFYTNYGKFALGIKQPEKVIEQLEKFKLIKYTKHNFRYSIQTGTDVDIDLAIDEAGRMVEMVTNVVHHLNQYFDLPFIPAKSVSYKKGTPRFFQFKLSEEPISISPEDEVDGFINLVFTDSKKAETEIRLFSEQCNEPILFGYYRNTTEIKRLLYEIQKIRFAIDFHKTDKDAIREFEAVEKHYRRLLNHYVLGNLYSDNGNVQWFYRGENITISSKQAFNQMLSVICEQTYPSTPNFRNDLMNKTNISSQISSARKRIVERMLANSGEENLGFDPATFPPEKSIYLALLRNTGIHKERDGFWTLDQPTDPTFQKLWEQGNVFLNSTKSKGRNLQDFVDILSAKPFKLKRGFIEFWIPIFLIIKRDEYALYESDVFVQELSSDIFDLLNKKPSFFTIKAFDVSGIKLDLFNRYRLLLNQAENNRPNNKAFIQTIKPFVVFYKQLPEYAKQTNRLSKQAAALRQIITKAKDPEKTFFEDFPTAFGYSIEELHQKPKLADAFIFKLQEAIRELRGSYDALLARFEDYFIHELIATKQKFPAYKEVINKRFNGLKPHLLLVHQKPFFTRLQSPLEDRTTWLESIAQVCIGKSLSAITDQDELVLYERVKDLVHELDNISEISSSSIHEEEEDVLKLEITSLVNGLNKDTLRIPKSKTREVAEKQSQIKQLLGKDKKINIAILTKLLQELLTHD
jgi:hypothetical protein